MTAATRYIWVNDAIIRETKFVPEEESSNATVFALANGYMGLRGAPEETAANRPGEKGCYVGGIYDTPTGKLTEREIVAFPDWLATRFSFDGEPFDLATGEVHLWEREIDLSQALMRRRLVWRAPSGLIVNLASERFVSMVRPHLGATRLELRVNRPCQVEILTGIDADVANRWAGHFKAVQVDAHDPGMLWLECRTVEPGYRLGVATRFAWDQAPEACQTEGIAQLRSVWEAHRFCLDADRSVAFERAAAVVENRFMLGELRMLAARELHETPFYGSHREAHVARWREVLERSDVRIDGDSDAQMGIRFSVAHLLMAAPWHSPDTSVPARGLQGQDYYGSIFWDCETFVCPMLAYTQPQVARHALGYRIATLPGARRKAARFGFRGAFYAWQSQESGDDQCDLYVFTDPRTGKPIRSYFCDQQIHISADVALAFQQYVDATGDLSIWWQGGAEVCAEIARFFVSRSMWNEAEARYQIKGVLGPDEYHEGVDDNAYTNWLAGESARIALDALSYMHAQYPAEHRALLAHIGLTSDELCEIAKFAEEVFRPQPDAATGLIEQFAGYWELLDEPVDATRARLAHPELHRGGPLGPFQETQNIKQADVIMLLYMLRDRFSHKVKQANWLYYEPRTAHDSSLSPMAYALVAAEIDKIEWAYRYFIYSAHIDLAGFGPHWNLGIHAASLGGAWLAIVHGFCRLRLTRDGPRFDDWPHLPQGWSRLVLPITWQGQPLRFTISCEEIGAVSFGDKEVGVTFPSGREVLRPNGAITRRTGR